MTYIKVATNYKLVSLSKTCLFFNLYPFLSFLPSTSTMIFAGSRIISVAGAIALAIGAQAASFPNEHSVVQYWGQVVKEEV